MKNTFILVLTVLVLTKVTGQENIFPQGPQEAIFETSDISNFWKAFELVESTIGNPFETYIENVTIGLKGFIPNRIISADPLLLMVNRRRQDYEKIRAIEVKIKEVEKRDQALLLCP